MNHTIIILLLFLILFLIIEKFKELNIDDKYDDILFKQFENKNVESTTTTKTTTTTKNVDIKKKIQDFKKHGNLIKLYSLMSKNNKIKSHDLLIENESDLYKINKFKDHHNHIKSLKI